MPSKTWVPGEEVLAPDLNSFLQQQAIQFFSNATTRNAAIPNPTVGMVTFRADTGGLEVFTDKTTPPSWRPPWNTAWGLIYSNIMPNVTLVAGYGWIVRALPVNMPGRNFKVEAETNIYQSVAGASTNVIRFQNGGSMDVYAQQAINAGWAERICLGDVYAGQAINELGVIGNSDSTAATTAWGRIRVFDVGPS